MKTRYKYIHFERVATFWECYNNKSEKVLGEINYYPSWRCWVFESVGLGIVFNVGCLRDIADFMEQLGAAKKSKTT